MTNNEKMILFNTMLYIEHKECDARDSENEHEKQKWFYMSEGAYFMLEEIGLHKEYINWAIGK